MNKNINKEQQDGEFESAPMKHLDKLLQQNKIAELNQQDEILDKKFGINKIKGKIILAT
jgi:hypothetical protein